MVKSLANCFLVGIEMLSFCLVDDVISDAVDAGIVATDSLFSAVIIESLFNELLLDNLILVLFDTISLFSTKILSDVAAGIILD